jgi:hypothetical protein
MTNTNNQYGLPFVEPVKQTILPVINTLTNEISGFFAIEETDFDGTETEFELLEGEVSITTVTLHPRIQDGSNYGVPQYMAAYYNDLEFRLRPWLGYTSFVDTNSTGFYRWFSMPTQGQTLHFGPGVLIGNLTITMDNESYTPATPTPPEAEDATLRWAASMALNSSQMVCGFFDFQWPYLFQAKSSAQPLSIEIIANPPGGEFKSTLVAQPTVAPGGAIQFNTVRIIKLQDPAPGDYEFTYRVTDDKNLSTTCTLTLTIT